MTTQEELEIALGQSIDAMRLAEQMLRLHSPGPLADLLREQADKNMYLLLPWARR
jgi:hypothetical protein